MKTAELITKYLESKSQAWSASTLRSEKYRLAAVASHIDGNAQTLWNALANVAPYSRLTTWTRVTQLWQWAADSGIVQGNPYRALRETNARLFKNVYEPKKPSISYEEAAARIGSISRESTRARAMQLLKSGMRFTESSTFDGETVLGKGSKRRRVFLPDSSGPIDADIRYATFWRDLRAVGLTPHMLRKLFLSRCVEHDFNEFELCEVAGWSSIQTATSYIKVNGDRLKKRVAAVQEGSHIDGVKVP